MRTKEVSAAAMWFGGKYAGVCEGIEPVKEMANIYIFEGLAVNAAKPQQNLVKLGVVVLILTD